MATTGIVGNVKTHRNYKPKKTDDVVNNKLSETKKSQLASFEQGLKETILISNGEMKGTTLSELWDE